MSKSISQMYAAALHDIADAIREHAAAVRPPRLAAGGVLRPAGTRFASERARGGYVVPPAPVVPADLDARFEEQGKRIGETLARALGVQPTPLDSSTVKAGDLVTVEIAPLPAGPDHKPYVLAGEAYASGSASRPDELAVGGFIIGHSRVKLLDHRPAADVRPLVMIDPDRARDLVRDHFDDDRSRALLDALLGGAR